VKSGNIITPTLSLFQKVETYISLGIATLKILTHQSIENEKVID
jgi:hypothetical protein